MCCANVGIRVVLVDMNQKALDAGLKVIQTNYERSVKSGSKSENSVKKALSLISTTTEYANLGNCDLVVEAVFEVCLFSWCVLMELVRIWT